MKLQYKIFLLFIFSSLITLVTTTSFVFSLLKKHNVLYENPGIEQAIADFIDHYSDHPGAQQQQTLLNTVATINREYVKGKILKKDILVTGIASLLLFLIFQAALLFFLVFFIIKLVTSQMNLINTGIRQIEKGDMDFRFPVLKGREFKIIGEELNRMLIKLADNERIIKEQSKLAGWQEVSSFLSHQLKNPLTSINLAAKNIALCRSLPDKDELVQTSLMIIEEETQRLNSLLARIRELSAFPQLTREQTDINRLIEDITQQYQPEKLVFDLHLEAVPPLYLDKQLMEQVFLNLFTNSREACEELPVTIKVTTRANTEVTEILVSDSVTGLQPGILDKIFIPKFSTKRGGMGLGLVFVRKIIAMHGGEITAKLDAHGGLVFTLSLPAGE